MVAPEVASLIASTAASVIATVVASPISTIVESPNMLFKHNHLTINQSPVLPSLRGTGLLSVAKNLSSE